MMKKIFLLLLACYALPLHADFSLNPKGRYQPEVLAKVLEKIAAVKAQNKVPVVLFDLDETLINSRTRTLRILRDYARVPSIQTRFPRESAELIALTGGEGPDDAASVNAKVEALALKMHAYGLYLEQILAELGMINPQLTQAIGKEYVDRYLSNTYCKDDLPLPGASEYVQRVYEAGAHIVYISGRNQPGMAQCTEENLQRLNFPFVQKERLSLILKPRRDEEDTNFKERALGEVSKIGTVVAGFENEPANLNAFKKAFPEGIYVFIDSMHSRRTEEPFSGAYWIKDYRSEKNPLAKKPKNAKN